MRDHERNNQTDLDALLGNCVGGLPPDKIMAAVPPGRKLGMMLSLLGFRTLR